MSGQARAREQTADDGRAGRLAIACSEIRACLILQSSIAGSAESPAREREPGALSRYVKGWPLSLGYVASCSLSTTS